MPSPDYAADSLSLIRPQGFAARAIPLAFTVAFSLLSLTACSFGDMGFGGGGSGGNASAPPSDAAAAQLATDKQPTPMDTFRALAPPEGMKFTPLFAENLSSSDERLSRLERSVQALRDDFDTVVPSMVRLVAVEKDMKDLIGQLKTLTDNTPPAVPLARVEQEMPGEDVTGGTEANPVESSSPVTPGAVSEGKLSPDDTAPSSSSKAEEAPVALNPAVKEEGEGEKSWPMPVKVSPSVEEKAAAIAAGVKETPAPATAAEKTSSPAASGAIVARAVRIADHKDKTRIVIDLSADAKYKATLEPKKLSVELPGVEWGASKKWDAMSANLIAGYVYEGGKLALDVLYPSEIKSVSILPPNNDNKNYRLVIDLYSKHVHGG